MQDVVSYNDKHNQANGEDNRDGANDNKSWNSGVEGETSDPAVLDLRLRRKRAMMATLMLSLGVPMMTAGDEFCRTQRGNNNAYCQDSPISWLNWESISQDDAAFTDFVRYLIQIRLAHRVFIRAKKSAIPKSKTLLG